MSGTNINFARVKDVESAANRSKTKLTELSNSIGTLANLTTTDKSSIVGAINEVAANAGGGNVNFPASDNKVYVVKNGAWVEATVVEQPSEWAPAIDPQEDIVLTLDDDMQPYQLTGTNLENSEE